MTKKYRSQPFRKLRENSYDCTLERITNIREHKELFNYILHGTRTRLQMMVNYLKHVSNIVALVSLFTLETFFKPSGRKKGSSI